MGTWALDPFGNDSACDWAFGLAQAHDLAFIKNTIEDALNSSDYSYEAIAAIDTIARLKGRFYEKNPYTEPVDKWVAQHPLTVPPELIISANKVLDKVLEEESELWGETDEDYDEFAQQIHDLKTRIS